MINFVVNINSVSFEIQTTSMIEFNFDFVVGLKYVCAVKTSIEKKQQKWKSHETLMPAVPSYLRLHRCHVQISKNYVVFINKIPHRQKVC